MSKYETEKMAYQPPCGVMNLIIYLIIINDSDGTITVT